MKNNPAGWDTILINGKPIPGNQLFSSLLDECNRKIALTVIGPHYAGHLAEVEAVERDRAQRSNPAGFTSEVLAQPRPAPDSYYFALRYAVRTERFDRNLPHQIVRGESVVHPAYVATSNAHARKERSKRLGP